MAAPAAVEGALNPLRPDNYKSEESFLAMVAGLHEAGAVVRTDEDVNPEFPVVKGVPFSYTLLGGPAVFATNMEAASKVLSDRETFSSQAGGTGILPFGQTNPGRQVDGAVAIFGEGYRQRIAGAVVFGDILTMDKPAEDHRMVRQVITTSPEFKGRDGEKAKQELPIEQYIGGLADEFIGELRSRIQAGEEVEITELASSFTYKTIAYIIGIDLSGADGPQKIQDFLQISQQAFLLGDNEFPVGISYVGDQTEIAGRSIMLEAQRVLREEHGEGSFLDRLRSTQFTAAILENAKNLPEEQRAARKEFVDFLEVAAQEASKIYGPITADEFIAAKLLLILMPAGSETTSTVITRGVHALLKSPEQRTVLKNAVARSEMGRPVEEFIRYASPVNLVARTAMRDVTVEGVEINAGERVYAMIGAANRDPSVYSEPWKLKLDRDEGSSLAFGTGQHVCPGALLARTEIAILFGKLSESGLLEEVKVTEAGLIDRTTPQLRSPKSLVVTTK